MIKKWLMRGKKRELMTWFTLHVDDDQTYSTTIHPTRDRALRCRESQGYHGGMDLVEDDHGGRALITGHDVPFSEVLLLSLLIASLGLVALIGGLLFAINQ